MIMLNIPVAVLCCKGISFRFTIFSLVQVFLSSIFLQIFNFSPIFTDEVLNVILAASSLEVQSSLLSGETRPPEARTL